MKPPAWAIRTKADEAALELGYWWDDEAGHRAVDFLHAHFKPKFSRKPFRLLQWQERFIRSVWSWKSPTGGTRWKRVILHIAKKNGKTLLICCLLFLELFLSEQSSPAVASASTSSTNAKRQVYSQLAYTIRRSPWAKFCKCTGDEIKVSLPGKDTASYWALSSRPESAEGLNLSVCVLDETHAMASDALLRAVEYSIIAREEDGGGLVVSISTAGDDLAHFYFTGWYRRAKNILSGDDLDPTTYAEVYEATGDPMDPRQWTAANPSLDLAGFTSQQFRLDLMAAKSSPTSWANFCRYRLNIFTSAAENRFIDLQDFDKCKQNIPDEALTSYDAVVGCDLSEVEDPTSVSITWALPGNRYHLKTYAWVCEAGVRKREAQNLESYRQYVRDGNFTILPGEMLNADNIEAFLYGLVRKFRVKRMVFDQRAAFVLMGRLVARGIVCERVPQTHRYFDQPMKEFHKAIKEGRLTHDGSEWLRASINNTRLDTTRDGAWRPDSRRSVDHIDATVASVMSFGWCYTVVNAEPPPVVLTWGAKSLSDD